MSATRDYAGGVYDPQHGFVITGGSGASDPSSTAERTYDGISFSPFPSPPGPLVGGHCLVSLKNGNLLAAGGLSTYMFNGSTNLWTTLASMPASKGGKLNVQQNIYII